MIDCLVFSKDRACQLELLLRSINENFTEIKSSTRVLYRATNEFFKKGYDLVKSKFNNFHYFEETNFIENTRDIVRGFENPLCLFLVDDEIVINSFEVSPYLNILTKNSDKVHCISLRMHPRVNYTYTWKLDSFPPKFLNIQSNQSNLLQNVKAWKWRIIDVRTDWGFPSCINSHIYLTDFYKTYIENLPFNSPNNFEIVFHFQRNNFKDLMFCFEKPKTLAIANNVTQEGFSFNSNNSEFSIESLNKKLLDGYIIEEKTFYGMEKNMATFDFPYTFRRGA